MSAPFLHLFAGLLRLGRRSRPRAVCDDPRILVIRRNRMGDMICTLPLLHALRDRFPAARIAVACDSAGEPIARACSAVDEVIPLRRGWTLWLTPLRYGRQWQGFDWVIAAKVGFDSRLARLARVTNAARRIGYENTVVSEFYTDPVPIPAGLAGIHQVEATLALLGPIGVPLPLEPTAGMKLDLPASAVAFADELAPFWQDRALVLVNVSSTSPLRFRDEDFSTLVAELAARDDLAIGIVGLAVDLPRAQKLVENAGGSARVIATRGSLELAALIGRARVLLTAEGGAAHLAAAMDTPAVVLWSEGPFEKWHSRGTHHTFVRIEPGENLLPLARVRKALALHLERGPVA